MANTGNRLLDISHESTKNVQRLRDLSHVTNMQDHVYLLALSVINLQGQVANLLAVCNDQEKRLRKLEGRVGYPEMRNYDEV